MKQAVHVVGSHYLQFPETDRPKCAHLDFIHAAAEKSSLHASVHFIPCFSEFLHLFDNPEPR